MRSRTCSTATSVSAGSGHEAPPEKGAHRTSARRPGFHRVGVQSRDNWKSPQSAGRWAEPPLQRRETAHRLGVEGVQLGVELRDLEPGLDVGRVLHVAADPVARRLAVLGDEHEAAEEDALQRHRHGEKAEGERVERRTRRGSRPTFSTIQPRNSRAWRTRNGMLPLNSASPSATRCTDVVRCCSTSWFGRDARLRLEEPVRLAQPLADDREHIERGAGVLPEETLERRAIDLHRAGGLDRDRVGRPLATVEQRELAEEVPRPELGEAHPPPGGGVDRDLHRALGDDVERGARIPAPEDAVPGREVAQVHRRGERGAFGRGRAPGTAELRPAVIPRQASGSPPTPVLPRLAPWLTSDETAGATAPATTPTGAGARHVRSPPARSSIPRNPARSTRPASAAAAATHRLGGRHLAQARAGGSRRGAGRPAGPRGGGPPPQGARGGARQSAQRRSQGDIDGSPSIVAEVRAPVTRPTVGGRGG